jgi:hypothetical protein
MYKNNRGARALKEQGMFGPEKEKRIFRTRWWLPKEIRQWEMRWRELWREMWREEGRETRRRIGQEMRKKIERRKKQSEKKIK